MELEDSIGRAVEELLMEREYNEFIKLLRYFVEIQQPKVDTVNVIKNIDNSYKLLDGDWNVISDELLEDLAEEVGENNINFDDLLISSLITLAPNKIILHVEITSSNREILDTIRKVFNQRMNICCGC